MAAVRSAPHRVHRTLALTALAGATGALAVGALLVGAATGAPVTEPVIRVAADGTGDVTTLQAAIDRLPNGGDTAYTVLVAKGRYSGQVNALAAKQNYTIRGETGVAGDVVITAGVSAEEIGSLARTSTLTLRGKNVTVADLTVENSFDESTVPGGSQAIAVFAGGDRQTFRNVRILGNQDTFFADSGDAVPANRVYVVDSYIAGDVDFVFGSSVIVIDRSTLHTLPHGGAIGAPGTREASPHGILITNSTLSSDAAANSTALGRPWHPSSADSAVRSAMVVRNSVLGSHIDVAQPWWDMSSTSWTTERFFEYANSGPGATVNDNRPQLTAEQAAEHTPGTYLAGSDGWNPTS